MASTPRISSARTSRFPSAWLLVGRWLDGSGNGTEAHAIVASLREGVALNSGDMLIQAKALGKESGEIPYGDFGAWCGRNVRVKKRQCEKYMRLADEVPEERRADVLDSGLSINALYAKLPKTHRSAFLEDDDNDLNSEGNEAAKPYWMLDEWAALSARAQREVIEAALTQTASAKFNRRSCGHVSHVHGLRKTLAPPSRTCARDGHNRLTSRIRLRPL